MCDPIGGLGLAFSVGMAASNYAAQQDLMSKQQSANDAWVAYQRRQSAEENARQEGDRQHAEAARQQALGQMGGDQQKVAQGTEQSRLEQQYSQGIGLPQDSQLTGDKLIQGNLPVELQNVSPDLQQDYYAKLTTAAQAARARIKALATIQSYGDTSQFGLVNRANDIYQTSGNNINLQNDMRRGSLAAYAVAKAVEPLKYQIGSGAGAAGGLSQAGAGIAGQRLGAAAGGSFGG